jgi:hypothetical protein
MTAPRPRRGPEGEPPGGLTWTALRRLDLTLDAIAQAFRIASTSTATAALDHLGDYMTGCDAVEPDDEAAFALWVARGRP